MAGESQQVPTSKADPSVLTTEALQREVEALKDLIDLKVGGLKDVVTVKFDGVNENLATMERHRVEQKQDTQREITKAFDANTEAIGAVEKIQSLSNERIGALEAERRGGAAAYGGLLALGGVLLAALAIAVTVILALNR